MIAQKRSLKKIVMTTGVVSMAIGLANTFSFADCTLTTSGTTGYHCYKEVKGGNTTDYKCIKDNAAGSNCK